MIRTPPIICNKTGASPKRKLARIAATTGSQSLEADTKDGEKYFRHQLKILCPKIVEKIASSRPTTMALGPYPKRLLFWNRQKKSKTNAQDA